MNITKSLIDWMSIFQNNAELEFIRYEFSQKTDNDEIESIEKELSLKTPNCIREFFCEIAMEIRFEWEFENPIIVNGIKICTGGGLLWSLDELPEIINSYNIWNTADRIFWGKKFPFLEMENGDMLAIDYDSGKVVYLCHQDDNEQTNSFSFDYELKPFFENWVKLGCPGPEGLMILEFMKNDQAIFDFDSDFTQKWFQCTSLA